MDLSKKTKNGNKFDEALKNQTKNKEEKENNSNDENKNEKTSNDNKEDCKEENEEKKNEFNPIEIVFNLMKNTTYNTICKNISDLKKEIVSLIEDKNINDNIKKIYKITMQKYMEFQIKESKNYDIDSLANNILLKKKER